MKKLYDRFVLGVALWMGMWLVGKYGLLLSGFAILWLVGGFGCFWMFWHYFLELLVWLGDMVSRCF